ncbi:DUF2642 domain-containing protein [Siminovitchia acidinfaciens]
MFLQNCQFVEGVLQGVKPDHLIAVVNNHIFYLASHQILALSKNAKSYNFKPVFVPYLERVQFGIS